MSKAITRIKREVSGRLGELLLRHYLTQKGIVTEDVGESDLPFDLIVTIPDGTIFEKKAVIQVKTETEVARLYPQYTFLPHKYQWKEILKRKRGSEYADHELWLALLWINWQNNMLQVVGCICSETKITDQDFRPSIKRPSVYFQRIWKKSPLKFSSRTPSEYA